MVPKVREIAGLIVLFATGPTMPLWAASLAAFVVALLMIRWRMRGDHQHRSRH